MGAVQCVQWHGQSHTDTSVCGNVRDGVRRQLDDSAGLHWQRHCCGLVLVGALELQHDVRHRHCCAYTDLRWRLRRVQRHHHPVAAVHEWHGAGVVWLGQLVALQPRLRHWASTSNARVCGHVWRLRRQRHKHTKLLHRSVAGLVGVVAMQHDVWVWPDRAHTKLHGQLFGVPGQASGAAELHCWPTAAVDGMGSLG